MISAHIEVVVTMSLEEALALEDRLASATASESEQVKAIRLALIRELAVAEVALVKANAA